MLQCIRKRLFIVFSVSFLVSLMIFTGTEFVHAAEYRLPSKIVTYYYDNNDGGRVYAKAVKTFKYDKKGNLLKENNDGFKTKYKNTYKKGKLKSSVSGSKRKGIISGRYYNSKGRCVRDVYKTYNRKGKVLHSAVCRFKTDSKGYIIKVTGDRKETNKIQYQGNGMPGTIKSGNTTYTFNSDGLIESKDDYWEDEKELISLRVTYTTSGNKITALTEEKVEGGDFPHDWEKERKVVYTLGSSKTKNSRTYVAMMAQSLDYFASIVPELHFEYGNG